MRSNVICEEGWKIRVKFEAVRISYPMSSPWRLFSCVSYLFLEFLRIDPVTPSGYIRVSEFERFSAVESWWRSATRKVLSRVIKKTRVNAQQDTRRRNDRAFPLSLLYTLITHVPLLRESARRMARKRVSNYLLKISDQYAGINRLVIATNLLIHYRSKKKKKIVNQLRICTREK